MNIIKFNDVILSAEEDPQLTQKQIDIFNDSFRGRYVYNVNLTDAVALEQMSTEQYREASKSKYIEKKIVEYKKINQYEELLDEDGNIDSSKRYYIGIINPKNNGDSYIAKEYVSSTVGYSIINVGNIYDADANIVENCSPFKMVPSSYCIYENTVGNIKFENRYDPVKNYFDYRITNNGDYTASICIYVIDGDEQTWGEWEYICSDLEVISGDFANGSADYIALTDFIRTHENVKILLEVDGDDGYFKKAYEINTNNAKIQPFCLEDLTKPFITEDGQFVGYDCLASSGLTSANIATSKTKYNNEHIDGCWKCAWYLNNNSEGKNRLPYSNSAGLRIFYDYWGFFNGQSYVGKNGNRLLNSQYDNDFGNIKNNQCASSNNYATVSLICRTEKTIYEENPDYLADFDSIPVELLNTRRYINFDATENVNSVTRFIESNKFHPDEEITVGELQNFRWWLAHELLELNAETEKRYDVLEMLRYYDQNMYDDTIRHLTTFTPKTSVDVLTAANRSTCGCQGVTGINILSAGLTTCDPIYIYRKAIYEKMVDTFSDVSFWTNQTIEFLEEFKRYIDGIIKMNFPLYTVDYISDLYDCGCLSDANASQERLMGYLKNLSKSLGYIIDEDMSSHKNFIGDSFNKWAAYLYEKMSWV